MKRAVRSPAHGFSIFFIICIAILCATGVWAANTPTILPYTNSFETYTNNQSIIGSRGWFADTNLYAVVTNWPEDQAYSGYSGTRPLDDIANHDYLVRLDTENSSVSSMFGGTEENTNVVIDQMILFVQSPDEDAQGVITNDDSVQLAYYVDTNGYLVVFHTDRYRDSGYKYTNAFTLIPDLNIPSGTWARVTITMDYKTDTSIRKDKYFQIAINDHLITNDIAYNVPSATNQPGTYFVCANKTTATTKYLSSVNYSGTGYIDDYTATGDSAPPLMILSFIFPENEKGGTIFPLGAVFLQPGKGTNFTIITSNYWQNTVLKTNDLDVTPMTNYIEFANVTEDHTLYAEFTADKTTNVPHWWLAQQNPDWTNNWDSLVGDDPDGDGMTTWQEYWASTDPDDVDSVFQIVEFSTTDYTNFTIKWPTASVDPDLGPFKIQRATNLVSNDWTEIGTLARSAGTSEFTDTAAPTEGGSNCFYRVAVTNAP